MNIVKETELEPLQDLPLIGYSEQSLFAIEDTRERADRLQELLVPKLKTILNQACDLIGEVYDTDVLSPYRIATTPAHRAEAKKTKPFEIATAGLAVKGQAWFFQQRFECSSNSLYVKFFGLRGLEGNPIVQVMKKHLNGVIRLLAHGKCELYSETIESSDEAEELEFTEFISRLQLAPERDWYGTYITGLSVALPIKNLDAARPVLDSFVILFPIFRSATNILCGEDDHFEYYAERFWDWQSRLQIQESVTATQLFPDEVDSSEIFREGAVRKISVNAYERDPKARQKCIDYYGLSCSVCGFNFGKVFGQLGEGFIHVHHLRPISEIGEEYEIDPVKDLRPVCPNCHAMIHRNPLPLSIEEVKKLLKTSNCDSVT